MNSNFKIQETAPFVEFTSVKVTDVFFSPLFDVEKIEGENLETYCQSLINKVFSLKLSEIPYFISHHCCISNNSMQWLNIFEKLIFVNEKLFQTGRNKSRFPSVNRISVLYFMEKHLAKCIAVFLSQ
ncbi:MAG: hypothetical protein LBE36_08230 [Flavobacteriaceae bacterium]|jgi:hypothetical protein|nr:hypothetical protein [Flavobacteriaceae bacterium]